MAREKVEDLPWAGLTDDVGAFTEFLPSCPMLIAKVSQMDPAGRPLPTEFFELLFDIWVRLPPPATSSQARTEGDPCAEDSWTR